MNKVEGIQADFDEIAHLADSGASGIDRYDSYLISLIPKNARSVLDIGCGLGRLTKQIAASGRRVVGIDLSDVMIEKAKKNNPFGGVTFMHADFTELEFAGVTYDSVISAAALHHMPTELALHRMKDLVNPGGRLIVHDLMKSASVLESVKAYVALGQTSMINLFTTGRARPPKRLRRAWARHGEHETYLTFLQAREMADRYLPGSCVTTHWMWRYTIVWDKPHPSSPIERTS